MTVVLCSREGDAGKRPVTGRSGGVAGGALPLVPRPDLLGPLVSRFWALADEVSDAEEQGDAELEVGSVAAELSSSPRSTPAQRTLADFLGEERCVFLRQGAGERVVSMAGGRIGLRPAGGQRLFQAWRARRICVIPSLGRPWTSRRCVARRLRFARLRRLRC
jgi:hypothetical protein